MKKTYKELPNWEFELDEVSANVYEVIGIDQLGRRVSSKGLDLDKIIEQCKTRAKELESAGD